MRTVYVVASGLCIRAPGWRAAWRIARWLNRFGIAVSLVRGKLAREES